MPTKIEWCDETWNPITGCTPVSDGCANCYASRMIGRNLPSMGHDGPFSRIQFHPDRLDIPLHWRKSRRIFVCSMGDLFHEDVKEEWIHAVLMSVSLHRQHTFMFLTKRPLRMREYMRSMRKDCPPDAFPNLWLGVTVENQEMADQRIPFLLQTPAAKRFVSIEPMLGPVDISKLLLPHDVQWANAPTLKWVICGGETGPGAREMFGAWPISLLNQCKAAGVPFFFKGWGTAEMRKCHPFYHHLIGQTWKEFPI